MQTFQHHDSDRPKAGPSKKQCSEAKSPDNIEVQGMLRLFILGVQAAQWAVLQLIFIHHSWQDYTDHVGCNNSCSPAFQNWMAEPAVSCEWMLNSDCFNCCTSHFRSTALIVWDVPREAVKSRKMRRLWNWFEGLLYFLLIFNRMQIKNLAFSDKCLINCKWPLHYQLQD